MAKAKAAAGKVASKVREKLAQPAKPAPAKKPSKPAEKPVTPGIPEKPDTQGKKIAKLESELAEVKEQLAWHQRNAKPVKPRNF